LSFVFLNFFLKLFGFTSWACRSFCGRANEH
jgi:hypothetical protein